MVFYGVPWYNCIPVPYFGGILFPQVTYNLLNTCIKIIEIGKKEVLESDSINDIVDEDHSVMKNNDSENGNISFRCIYITECLIDMLNLRTNSYKMIKICRLSNLNEDTSIPNIYEVNKFAVRLLLIELS